MKILALEFSTNRRSVAVFDRAAPGCVSGLAVAAEGRATAAFALVDKALSQAGLNPGDIACLAVGLGPGSYTGIRAAISIAQGWQLARRVRLLGISSVECMAAQLEAEGRLQRSTIIVDAQRNEFYLAVFEFGESGRREIEPLHLVTRAEVESRAARGEYLAGSDAEDAVAAARVLCPDASMLARLASTRTDYVAGEKLEPIYLREAKFVKAPPPRIV